MGAPRCIQCGAYDDCDCLCESTHEPGPDCGCDDCAAQADEQDAYMPTDRTVGGVGA